MTASVIEDRVTQLEIKLTYQDDVIRTLNEVVIELRGEVERLDRKVMMIEQQLRAGPSDPGRADDPPPHY